MKQQEVLLLHLLLLMLKVESEKGQIKYLNTQFFFCSGDGNNSQRRASVTVSGSGGLTGLIQSALNQVRLATIVVAFKMSNLISII